jgi:hypothetical protein
VTQTPDVYWIAWAPPGVVSTGPAAISQVETMTKYRDEMGWTVEGPYFHYSRMLSSCVECPSCGAEVDTREARPL